MWRCFLVFFFFFGLYWEKGVALRWVCLGGGKSGKVV